MARTHQGAVLVVTTGLCMP